MALREEFLANSLICYTVQHIATYCDCVLLFNVRLWWHFKFAFSTALIVCLFVTPTSPPPLHCLGGQSWLPPQPSPRWTQLCQFYPGVASVCPRTLLPHTLLVPAPLPSPSPSSRAADSVVGRQRMWQSAGAFSLVCCSPSSFPTSGSTTCSTTASAPWAAEAEAAVESRPEESCSCPTSILGYRTQTSR